MKARDYVLPIFILMIVLISGCSQQEKGASAVKTCTSDTDCEEGFSCWARTPLGPSAGIRGSKENPGACWDNKQISRIY